MSDTAAQAADESTTPASVYLSRHASQNAYVDPVLAALQRADHQFHPRPAHYELTIAGDSNRPVARPDTLPPAATRQLITEWATHPGIGPERIYARLRRRRNEPTCSLQAIRWVLQQAHQGTAGGH